VGINTAGGADGGGSQPRWAAVLLPGDLEHGDLRWKGTIGLCTLVEVEILPLRANGGA
jgi:hypothetical protein